MNKLIGKSGDHLNFQDSRNPNNWLVEVKLEIFPKSGCSFQSLMSNMPSFLMIVDCGYVYVVGGFNPFETY